MEIRYSNGGKYDRRMEHWSSIHNTFKFFNLGRPPFLEKIEKSSILKKRIILLNKIKQNYLKKNLLPPNFGELKIRELDKKINLLVEKINLQTKT